MMQVVLYWIQLNWVWGFWSVTLMSTESDNNCNTLSQKKICGLWLMTNWNSSNHCPAACIKKNCLTSWCMMLFSEMSLCYSD